MRTLVLPPYCCYLRVYEPASVIQKQAAGMRTHTLEIDGEVLVCPDEPALRNRRALTELADQMPEDVLSILVSAGALEGVDLTAFCDDEPDPDAVPHILTARWHVPPVWFVIFGDEERRVGMDPVRELRYRTPMVQARRRIGRAYRLLHVARPDWQLEPLVALGRWIEAFHPHAWVELDYGGLVHLMDDQALYDDRSAEDVRTALQAVAEGNDKKAWASYCRLRKRWLGVRAKERAS
ncbi:MAG TPA: hypothetical protein VIL34_12375 [Actinopolymorphaceae bacterium]|jgi:hypothetical protein